MSLLKSLHSEIKLTCQPTSRYLKYQAVKNSKVQTIGVKPNDKQLTTCAFCGNDYIQSQQRVRLRSRVKLKKKVERLLHKYQVEPGSLGKYQLSLVQSYLNSCNQLVVTCSICNKTTKFPCSKRSDVLKEKTKVVENSKIVQNVEESGKKKKKKKKKSKQEKTVSERVDVNLKDVTSSQGKGLSEETYKVKHETSSTFTPPVTRSTPSVIKTASHIYDKKMSLDQNTTSKSAKKKKGKNIHQQLNKIFEKEKRDKKSGNLMDFLSTL